MTEKPAVSVRNLWKIFKQGSRIVKALQDVSLEVPPGEFLALRGSSGSGKSTLLNIIGGLDIQTKGEAETLSATLSSLGAHDLGAFRRRNIGFVFQELTLVPHLTAIENVMLPLAFEAGKARARPLAEDLLQQAGLADRSTHRPRELSYGERQRVALARAVIRDPRVLLADEPTANLDDANVDRVWRILAALREAGTTIIVATHDPRLEAHADRIVRLEQGQLRQ